ncbi:MAG: YgeY family selenium metabolism-linked hydrolase [Synergistaceae bacterium]|nr:YgeY family selenium metabolism-linked hydrolase [Synergistaceae bacterium]
MAADSFGSELVGLVPFAQSLVRLQSFSGKERDVAEAVHTKMVELGYDEVFFDRTGNVVGRIGSGPKKVLFDSHMDTVEVSDAEKWQVPPFSGLIVDGRLYGRGSVDMKSALAASVYAGGFAKRSGLSAEKTVYVVGSVCEEYCDGESLRNLFMERHLKPDFVVICEPSDNRIALGHKGKAQVRIHTHGLSAHGAAPEKGINAVYEMAEIIQRVEKLNQHLSRAGEKTPHGHGTVVLSNISCVSASLNAVPSECSIYLDRRMIPGETEEDVKKEMDGLIAGEKASWELGTLEYATWTGTELYYEPLHTAWKIDPDHELTRACNRAYDRVFGKAGEKEPDRYDFWDFSTNAVTPVRLGIPTIGFGPGDYRLAHMRDENCRADQIEAACRFYTALIEEI